MAHIPYGYRIENGLPVIDEEKAEQVRKIAEEYLAGSSLVAAARDVGLTMFHSGVKRLMQNRRYLGDGYYPPILTQETFNAVAKEMQNRAAALGRTDRRPKTNETAPATAFTVGEISVKYADPFRQAEYAYSLIESEG